MTEMLSHMWGDEESYPAMDMEVDWGGSDEDKMSDVSLEHMFDNEEYDWRAALRVVGLGDEYISKYNDIPILQTSRRGRRTSTRRTRTSQRRNC